MKMMRMMLRMTYLHIFDMEGFLREYREGTRRSRSLSEFSGILLLFSVSSAAGKPLRNNLVATKIYSAAILALSIFLFY